MDQRVDARRRFAEAVDELVGQIVGVGLAADQRNAAVDVHALLGRGDVALGDVGRDSEIGRALGALRHCHAPRLEHGFAEELHIHIIADVDHVAGLLGAEQVARAADLEIAHGDLEARAELRKVADRVEALLGDLGQHLVAPEGQIGRGPARRAADAAADLVELRKAHLVGVLDDQGVDVRDVDAGLDDRGADEHLDLAVRDVLHDIGEHGLVHLPVRHGDRHVAELLLELARGALDIVDAVVQVVDLAAALQLAPDGVGEDAPVVLHDEGLHGQTVLGRLLDRGHIADAGHGHVQRAGDRRGRERQHVDAARELLDVLLVRHAEALLLVDDEQSEILEFYILTEQPVRADDEVDLAGGELRERLRDLAAGAEAAEHRDIHRKTEKALQGGLVVLLREHGRRHEDRGLLAVEHTLHHGAQRDLGLAEAHVAAEQSVHRDRALHVALDFIGAFELIIGLGIAEILFKLVLPLAVGRKGVARQALALGIQGDQLFRHVLGRALGARAGTRPLGAAELREPDDLLLARPGVLRHHVELGGRDVETVGPGVVDFDIVLLEPVDVHLDDAGEAADAVVFVHDDVADREIGVGLEPRLALGQRPSVLLFSLAADQLRVGQYGEADARIVDARRDRTDVDAALALARQLVGRCADQRLQAVVPEELLQHLGAALVGGEDGHAVALLEIELDVVGSGLGRARVGRQLPRLHAQQRLRRQGIAPDREGVGHVDRQILEAAQELVKRELEAVRRHGDQAAAVHLLHVHGELLLILPRALGAAVGLVKEDDRVGGDIIRPARHRIDHRQIAVGVGERAAV